MDNSNGFQNKCNKKSTQNSINQKLDLGLASITYAEYVILSSTLAYAIAEELNDSDLDMLIVFGGMIVSDLAILRTRRGILNALKENTGEEASIGGTESADTASELQGDLTSSTSNGARLSKKKRKIKSKKKIKKSRQIL